MCNSITKDYPIASLAPIHWREVAVALSVWLGLFFSVHALAVDDEWPALEVWVVSDDGILRYVPEKEVRAPVFKKHWVEKSREGIARSWSHFNDVVDTYVSNDDVALVNDSFVRLRLGNTFYEDGVAFNVDLKLKSDLARTENRLGLWASNTFNFFLDTDPEDQKSLQEQSLDRSADGDKAVQNISAGFSFAFDELEKWEADFDLGVRSGNPLDVFSRVAFLRKYEVTEDWSASWQHRLYAYYYRDSGYQSDFKIGRKISKKWHYRNTSEVKWNHDERLLTYANISAFEQLISNTSRAVWSFGGFYEDYPRNFLTSYFLEVRYTRRLYEDWFFVELAPRVDFFHEDDFASTPSFLLRFDVLFSN